jgi:hypothetical protein
MSELGPDTATSFLQSVGGVFVIAHNPQPLDPPTSFFPKAAHRLHFFGTARRFLVYTVLLYFQELRIRVACLNDSTTFLRGYVPVWEGAE